jgi:NAD-dependent dihydropyrimidine dehydrogenase PreA subunit
MLCAMNDCTGCMACLHICGAGAIRVVENDEGFLYPVVDKTSCTECHLCEKVCPVMNPSQKIEVRQRVTPLFQKTLRYGVKAHRAACFLNLQKLYLLTGELYLEPRLTALLISNIEALNMKLKSLCFAAASIYRAICGAYMRRYNSI